MDKYVLFVLLTYAVVANCHPNVTKQYRADYVYNHETNAFYKIHTESAQAWQAMKICEIEGGKLINPTSQEDQVQLLEMFGRFPNLGEYAWIAHNFTYDMSEEYDLMSSAVTPLEWQLATCYAQDIWLNVVEKNCTERLPFICKVEASVAPYDELCGAYGNNYHHVPLVGSCYKIARVAYTWPVAYAECRGEGGHLLVLNSEKERLAVQEITRRTPRIVWSQNSDYLFAGYREVKINNTFTREFKTIFNETLEEAGFAGWGRTEPNGWFENCGCVYIEDSSLADISCGNHYGFICEKEIPLNKTSPAPPANYQPVIPDSSDKPALPDILEVPSKTDLPHLDTTSRVKKYTYTQTVVVDFE